MPRQVSRWITKDDREFSTEAQAEAHENTIALIPLLRARGQGASESKAVYSAIFDAFLAGYIQRTKRPVE